MADNSMTIEPERISDIEDIGEQGELERRQKERVLPRALRKRGTALRGAEDKAEGDSFIPGSQTVYVKTWGCTHNTSDGEYMAGLLAASGYKITDSPLDAGAWLLNSCTVKGPSEDGFKSAIKKGRDLNKVIVVSGCVPQGQKDLPELRDLSVVGVQQIDRVVEVVEETLKGHTVHLFRRQRAVNGRRPAGPSLDLPKIRRNPLIEIIPINSGCLNHCTYCKTKHARGDLASYPPEDIVDRARQAFSEGVVEVWLTSEDTGAYGRDIDVSLPDLLWQLVQVVPDGCMLRIGMTNPPYIMDHLQEIAKILRHPRVYSFLHIPVQSGADPVLAAMKREYTVSHFRKVVDFLRKEVPGITIATDIICGFPTETEEDFEETLQLVKEYKFPSLFINQFYPRPGTPAAKMRRIPTNEVKQRSRRLTELFRSYETYTSQEGRVQDVLVTELSHDKNYYVAHNKSYEQVLVPLMPSLLGKMIKVKIASTGKHYLMGELLDTVSVECRPHPHAPPMTTGAVSGLERWRIKQGEDCLDMLDITCACSKNSTAEVTAASKWVWQDMKTADIVLVLLLLMLTVLIYFRFPKILKVMEKMFS